MAIDTLPSAPQPTDTTSQFNAKAFAWVAALSTWTPATPACTHAHRRRGTGKAGARTAQQVGCWVTRGVHSSTAHASTPQPASAPAGGRSDRCLTSPARPDAAAGTDAGARAAAAVAVTAAAGHGRRRSSVTSSSLHSPGCGPRRPAVAQGRGPIPD